MSQRTHRLPSRRRSIYVMAALLAIALTSFATLGVATYAWAEALREEGRLLPGTTIGSVDVGGATRDEAIAAVDAQVRPRLDRPITITSGDRRWETSARALGASTDVEDLVEQGYRRTTSAGMAELARIRWTGASVDLTLDPRILLPPDGAEALLADIAAEVDVDPRDATLTWTGTGFEGSEHTTGAQVDRAAAVDLVLAAVDDEVAEVALPVEELVPAVTSEVTDDAERRITSALAEALDRTVTLATAEQTWTTTPRALAAVPDVEPLLRAALAGDDVPEVALTLSEEPLEDYLATIASSIDVAARSASVDYRAGSLQISPERTGAALDRAAAGEALRAAVAGEDGSVELVVRTVRPTVTAAALEKGVLVVSSAERRLHLFRNGAVARSWPVAVGEGGSPTPTGVFTVGAKRFEPTWTNPSPDGWGRDMPAQIGPSPDNPLGARALNWNRPGGRDTLIRFHGTPNEASIGQAASKGCVRMYNADVIELYDLVPSGTTILSL